MSAAGHHNPHGYGNRAPAGGQQGEYSTSRPVSAPRTSSDGQNAFSGEQPPPAPAFNLVPTHFDPQYQYYPINNYTPPSVYPGYPSDGLGLDFSTGTSAEMACYTSTMSSNSGNNHPIINNPTINNPVYPNHNPTYNHGPPAEGPAQYLPMLGHGQYMPQGQPLNNGYTAPPQMYPPGPAAGPMGPPYEYHAPQTPHDFRQRYSQQVTVDGPWRVQAQPHLRQLPQQPKGRQECQPEGSSKPRRRTTQEQVQILSRFFDQTPKPDGTARQHIAKLVGMTVRETQVWFQNRRSKAKMARLAEDRAALGLPKLTRASKSNSSGSRTASASSSANPTPETRLLKLEEEEDEARDAFSSTLPSSSSMSSLAPPAIVTPSSASNDVSSHAHAIAQAIGEASAPTSPSPSGAPRAYRRQSIANGEAANISQITTKRKTATLGSAAMARRDSSPYASIHTASETTGAASFGPGSPSANVLSPARGSTLSLHRAVVHNNTRRASMPAPPPLTGPAPLASNAALQSVVSHSKANWETVPVQPQGLQASPVSGSNSRGLHSLMLTTPRRTASIHNGDEENAAIIRSLALVSNTGMDHVALQESTTHTATDTLPTLAPGFDAANVDPSATVDWNLMSSTDTNQNGDEDPLSVIFGLGNPVDTAPGDAGFNADMFAFLNSIGNQDPTTNGPLPSPAFQFGAANNAAPLTGNVGNNTGSMAAPGDAFTDMQIRDRIGSMASINTFASENSGTNDWSSDQYQSTSEDLGVGMGFDVDFGARRSSAPDALQWGVNQMGLGSAPATSTPIRPSPLGPNHTVSYDSLPSKMMAPSFPTLTTDSSMFGSASQMPVSAQSPVVNNKMMSNMNPRMNGTSQNLSPAAAMRRYSSIGVGTPAPTRSCGDVFGPTPLMSGAGSGTSSGPTSTQPVSKISPVETDGWFDSSLWDELMAHGEPSLSSTHFGDDDGAPA